MDNLLEKFENTLKEEGEYKVWRDKIEYKINTVTRGKKDYWNVMINDHKNNVSIRWHHSKSKLSITGLYVLFDCLYHGRSAQDTIQDILNKMLKV